MPGRMRLRTALAQIRGDHRPEVVHPAAHGLVRDRDPALRKQILDVTKAEREPEIEPNRLMYDLWREPISGVADFPHTLGYSAYVHPTCYRRRDKATSSPSSHPAHWKPIESRAYSPSRPASRAPKAISPPRAVIVSVAGPQRSR